MNEILNDIESTEETERENLCMVQIVTNIEPIVNRDFIEKVQVGGYFAVCEKGIHNIGDYVVVIRYDSIVPDLPIFEFMRQHKFKVKAKKFNIPENHPIYSQVIVLPITNIEEQYQIELPREEEFECASLLNVKKYIKPIDNRTGNQFGRMLSKGNFPVQWIDKTDENNLANYYKVLSEYIGKKVVITRKDDGSSMTCLIRPDTQEFIVCSRKNILINDETNSFWYVAKKYNIENILKDNPHLAIQGELVGGKVQGNKLCLSDFEFHVFNIIDLNTRRRLPFNIQWSFCEMYNLIHVPVIEIIDNFNYTIQDLLEIADKEYCPGSPIEGIVIRTFEDEFSPYLKKTLSTKIINPQFK